MCMCVYVCVMCVCAFVCVRCCTWQVWINLCFVSGLKGLNPKEKNHVGNGICPNIH